jgi:tellurite resistance protein
MLAEQIHRLVQAATHHGHAGEHEAVVDLLVLTAFADHRITQEERDGLEEFDRSHADWDEGAFSVQQYLPEAVASVRGIGGSRDAREQFIEQAAARITSRNLRQAAPELCEQLASADGASREESDVVAAIRSALR